MRNYSNFRGFLFIGDPHASSTRPGRRSDDYVASTLGKLSQAAQIARERSLVPVILGDLIHRDAEDSLELVSALINVMREFPCPPLELEGNHGKRQFSVGSGDVEHLLNQVGAIELLSGELETRQFVFDGVPVTLYACPHGTDIPKRLPTPAVADAVQVLITHHDLAFQGAYPGATALTEVGNCRFVVNGHMHKTTPSVEVGQTLWHNPGNIEPLSLDCIDHVPSVWEWLPSQEAQLTSHPLRHVRECFDMTGKTVAAAESEVAVTALLNQQSVFASLLAEEEGSRSGLEAARSEDGTLLLEDLEDVLLETDANEAVATLLRSLAQTVAKA